MLQLWRTGTGCSQQEGQWNAWLAPHSMPGLHHRHHMIAAPSPPIPCSQQTIKASKVPIIAICNDKYSTKLKSLRNHTIELDFRK